MAIPDARPNPSRGTGACNQTANVRHQFVGVLLSISVVNARGWERRDKENAKYYSQLGIALH